MNSKKMIVVTFSLLLCALLVMGTVTVVIDPLFQYHKPWFGMEAYVQNARYQNAGVAKHFDFENVVIGNSMAENFVVSDVEDTFGGETVKLTAAGSHVIDWTYSLNILRNREEHPKNILINFDAGFFDSSSKETKHELPTFLYDNNYLNDVEYIFNFTLTRKYMYRAVVANIDNTVPDYNTVFMWSKDHPVGKEFVLKTYNKGKEKESNRQKTEEFYTDENLELMAEYFETMPDTQFVFFCSPFSMLYWCDKYETNQTEAYKKEFEKSFEFLSKYDNVTVYFWADDEMLDIMSDLDNYKDSTHYGAHINKEILVRIKNNMGVLPKDKKEQEILLDKFFTYINTFNYEKLFE